MTSRDLDKAIRESNFKFILLYQVRKLNGSMMAPRGMVTTFLKE